MLGRLPNTRYAAKQYRNPEAPEFPLGGFVLRIINPQTHECQQLFFDVIRTSEYNVKKYVKRCVFEKTVGKSPCQR